MCSVAEYFAHMRTVGVLRALGLTSLNSACWRQPASWVCNAATKIHQSDKEGRRANISEEGVRSFRGK